MFKDLITEMKAYLVVKYPTLKEEDVKEEIYHMLSQSKSDPNNIKTMKEYFKENFKNHTHLKNEVELILSELPSLSEKDKWIQVEQIYPQIVRGFLLPEEQVYARVFYPMHPYKDVFSLTWSIGKAITLIKSEQLKKEYFPVDKMNVAVDELDTDHIHNAIHNKKPAILVSYGPFIGRESYHFLIDGNHRAHASFQKQGKPNFPVFKLSEENTIRALLSKYHRRLYQLHYMLVLFRELDNISKEELEKKLETYNHIKRVIAEEGE